MRTQAIVLKKIKINEHDELLVCYTDSAGKQVYQAKSILRPTSKQALHLDVLNLVDFSVVEGKSTPIITSAVSVRAFTKLKSKLAHLSAAHFLLECFDKLIFEGEADNQLWAFLCGRLNELDESENINLQDFINVSRRDFLKILGYDPSSSIESLANVQFKSLQFARMILPKLG